jgi:hypothetical protein
MSQNVTAIRFKQWLEEWNAFDFDPAQHRKKPSEYIYLFAMSARRLQALSGVYRRRRDETEAEGLQRLHDAKRSDTIREFVRYGHPYSSLKPQLRDEQASKLRKPGWLPTAIVVNILSNQDRRRGRSVSKNDLVTIEDRGSSAIIKLPYSDERAAWEPTALEPIEVIDGQHRLWAFNDAADSPLPLDFELPVVAFHGLDIGWQAYLFWSINVSPKRINPSHAFDLFPLLRSEAWLETFSELKIYREARAQELTELLFLCESSPWNNRINMLGESKSTAPVDAGVTQAGWVRALGSSFLSPGGARRNVPGLFSAAFGEDREPLGWSRAQQAAVLIHLWRRVRHHVSQAHLKWTEALRDEDKFKKNDAYDPAFEGPKTMLNQEQGVRGILAVANEIFVARANGNLELFHLPTEKKVDGSTDPDDVEKSLVKLRKTKLASFIGIVAQKIATFDWRSSNAKELTHDEQLLKRAFRGSGGYVALRGELIRHLAQSGGLIGKLAERLPDLGK